MNSTNLPLKPAPVTKAMEKRRFNLLNKLRKAAETDPELASVAAKVNDLWHAAYTEMHRREWVKAEAQDNGEVCWTVFVPERHQVRAWVRTPNRFWQELFYSWGGHHVLGQQARPDYRLSDDPFEQLPRMMDQAWNDERRVAIAA